MCVCVCVFELGEMWEGPSVNWVFVRGIRSRVVGAAWRFCLLDVVVNYLSALALLVGGENALLYPVVMYDSWDRAF